MKKNIAILLILPFIVSLLSIVVVRVTFPMIDLDISGIYWDYQDYECFFLQDAEYPLKAEAITVSSRHLVENENLVWTVENADDAEQPHARIIKRNSDFYLKPLSVGDVYITCSNSKGNVSRRLNGVVYVDDVIIVQTEVPSSQNNVDSTLYVGTHDFNGNSKVSATLGFTVRTIPNSIMEKVVLAGQSSNISVDMSSHTVRVLGQGDAYFTLQTDEKTFRTFAFKVVEGVNVYTYNDLLNCTNRSQNGENIVLRKSFESVENAYYGENGKYDTSSTKAQNIACFGNYDAKTGKFNFKNEVYSFKTVGDTQFISQWNAFARGNADYKEISDKLVAGLHVQKNIYGNGFTINFHNLTYPYLSVESETDGESFAVPVLDDDNLFRGPLPFYALGNVNAKALATIYGQDNVGLYLDGDNITVNDLNVRNCNPVSSLAFLKTVGTVVETNGRNITVQNSVLSCGRNVLRTFSSDVNVQNCMLSYAANFLLDAGSYKTMPVDVETVHSFAVATGGFSPQTVWNYLQPKTAGDNDIKNFVTAIGDNPTGLKKAFRSISEALNSASVSDFDGEIVVEDCLFYKSGITSIGLENTFNGPFMLTGQVPSAYIGTLNQFGLVPYMPQNIGRISLPVKVTVKGESKFFDYKTENDVVLDGYIGETVSDVAYELGVIEEKVTLQDVLPVGKLLYTNAQSNGYLHSAGGYFNAIATKSGGGANFSVLQLQLGNCTEGVSVDFVDEFATDSSFVGMAGRVILVVIGGEPFNFYYNSDEALLLQAPVMSTLRENFNKNIVRRN